MRKGKMMSLDVSRQRLLVSVDSYLAGGLSAGDFVRFIDDLVSADVVAAFPIELRDAVDAFQDLLALYVRDESTRNESLLYFGDAELKRKARAFREVLTRLRVP